MSRHLSGAPLKGVKEKHGKVPHLPPTEPQKRQYEKHHLQMYPPETGFTPLKTHLHRLGSALKSVFENEMPAG